MLHVRLADLYTVHCARLYNELQTDITVLHLGPFLFFVASFVALYCALAECVQD